MLRNRLLFSQNDKNKSQARTAISRKPRAAHNIGLRSQPKAKLAAKSKISRPRKKIATLPHY